MFHSFHIFDEFLITYYGSIYYSTYAIVCFLLSYMFLYFLSVLSQNPFFSSLVSEVTAALPLRSWIPKRRTTLSSGQERGLPHITREDIWMIRDPLLLTMPASFFSISMLDLGNFVEILWIVVAWLWFGSATWFSRRLRSDSGPATHGGRLSGMCFCEYLRGKLPFVDLRWSFRQLHVFSPSWIARPRAGCARYMKKYW